MIPNPVRSRPLARFLHLTLLFCSLTTVVISVSAAGFRSAIAVRTVTPDPLLPVSGGVGASRPTKIKQGELTVRALVLEVETNRIAIISSDFLGFPAALGNRVRQAVTNIPPSQILIGATHTHSAPDCYGFPDGKGGTGADLKYLDFVCTQMAAAIQEATQKLQPSRLRVATGEARGKIAYNYYADALYDPRCHVIQTVADSGKPIATLVNYAIHPEVIGNNRGICSPDLIGPLYDRIAQAGGGVGIFMNSAQGGMVTADNRRPNGQANDWAECERIGHLLADEALRIIQDAPQQSSPRLSCYARAFTLPVDSPLMRQLMKAVAVTNSVPGPEDAVITQVNLIDLGNARILTIPGEALPNIGYYLKRKMKGEHNLLFGLTNDAFGYILTREDFSSFKRYDYVSQTSLGERTGTIFVDEALKFINDCPAPGPARRN